MDLQASSPCFTPTNPKKPNKEHKLLYSVLLKKIVTKFILLITSEISVHLSICSLPVLTTAYWICFRLGKCDVGDPTSQRHAAPSLRLFGWAMLIFWLKVALCCQCARVTTTCSTIYVNGGRHYIYIYMLQIWVPKPLTPTVLPLKLRARTLYSLKPNSKSL